MSDVTLASAPAVADRRADAPRDEQPQALVWDSTNTSAAVAAHALRRLGYRVHWIGSRVSPWETCSAFDGTHTRIEGPGDPRILQLFQHCSFDVLFLHGDDHVRWTLDHWDALPQRVHASLAPPESLRTALSKAASLQLAERLGVPALPTERVSSPEEAAAASSRLAPGGRYVLKGEGGAAGTAVAACSAGHAPDPVTWDRVTRFAPQVLVQRRIDGPRVFASVVYEHGHLRAFCLHEKIASFPYDFGPTAYAVTRHVPEVLESSQRMFEALRWHGVANIEFRQDRGDGRWYFMEINPRAAASLGIQEAAGIDLAGVWAAVATGRGSGVSPGATYRDGVRFAWGVRGLALALRRPWSVPAWAAGCFASGRCDLAYLDPALRVRALRLALWMARHA
jgi:predicted ATP-grasp superfamily ATP-dependent carboligase